MACLPLIERELRVALRKQRPVQSRLKVAGWAVAGCSFFLLIGAIWGGGGLGRSLEQFLCIAGLYFVVRVPALTAGVLAEERRNETLGLLFLSGMGPVEVFASKFLSAALVAFTGLLALFPMLALPFLIGGVPFDLFLATICSLPTLMLFALAISMLASVLAREEGAASVLAFSFGAALCVLPPAIYSAQEYLSTGSAPSSWWLRLSPAYGPRLLWTSFRTGFLPGQKIEFWRNLVVTWAWSATALAAAAFALKQIWRERGEEDRTSGWLGRWREFAHGNRESRRQLAQAWLEGNPFVWLAARDRQPVTLGTLAIGGIVLGWVLCWTVWPRQWPGVQNFFITATLLNLTVGWFIRHTAARALGQARRDGAYELLLTTSLSPEEIVWGTLEALRWQFRRLAHCVFVVNLVMMLAGLLIRRWNGPALVVYFMIWALLLSWTWRLTSRTSRVLRVMWASLNCGRPDLALWRTSGLNQWSWIWVVFSLQGLARGLRGFPSGSFGELLFVLFCACAWLILVLWNRAPSRKNAATLCEERLISEFREIVREPLPDPNDPRFKQWDVRERFPWGWKYVQQQLHERLARK
jgi:ABC-type transport system involved in multi-copper enzyme maturation permease subunit